MKLMVMPRSKEEAQSLCSISDAFVIGYQSLCVNVESTFSKEEIHELKDLCRKEKKELFILLNKNMFEQDLPLLQEALFFLEKEDIDGIFYYDIAVLELKKEHSLSFSLVWAQEHMTTNALTSNFWYQQGVEYTLLSSEITKEEVSEIRENAHAKLIFPIFGYPSMFVSKRHLITNYCDTFQLKDTSKIHYLSDAKNTYPIQEDEQGTVTYASHIMNGIEEMPCFEEMGIDYVLLQSIFLEKETFHKVVELYRNVTKETAKARKEEIQTMLNCDEGFLYKETIYKVKS